MNIRVSLKRSDRFTQRLSRAQRDFLAERIRRLGKRTQRRYTSQ